MTSPGKTFLPVAVAFVACVGFIFAANSLWTKYAINRDILLAANVLFLVLNLLILVLQKKSAANPNPHAFIRAVIGSMMFKMFAVVAAVLVYVLSSPAGYDKKAVFISLIMYLIYLGAEVAAISASLRKKNV